MNCHRVQSSLSLYLYGELPFAAEEQFEEHLQGCAFCQLALGREKEWHASMKSVQPEVPADLLLSCRSGLIAALPKVDERRDSLVERWRSWVQTVSASFALWPARAGTALMLLSAGFWAGRYATHNNPKAVSFAQPEQMSVLTGPYTRIRDIQAQQGGTVRLVLERVQEDQVNGALSEQPVRQLVIAATKDPADPGIRVDSLQALAGQDGADVRDALLASVQQDPNAAVRLKALQALSGFANDPITRRVLIEVLGTDDSPGVRSAAIDLLLPQQGNQVAPDLLPKLRQLMTYPQDDYVRARCSQVLRVNDASYQVY